MIFLRFTKCKSGSMSIMAGMFFMILVIAAGGSLDYSRLVTARADLQRDVDTATLAAARQIGEPSRKDAFSSMMSAAAESEGTYKLAPNGATLTGPGDEIVGRATAKVQLIFGSLVSGESLSTISAEAKVGLARRSVEVSLVVDMSSSMIEDGRFVPARDAVKSFIRKFDDGNGTTTNARLAIVPFSSRINFGMTRPNIFGTWNGDPAIPDRWINPEDYHDMTKWQVNTWIDNVTKYMSFETYRRWVGCAEPRLDVAIEQGATTFDPTDDSPSDIPFISMEHNPSPGRTFCPPPIQPLTNSAATLLQAADALSSQGSTRLDAGIAGAWYTLSPSWGTTWGTGHAPDPYSDTETRKIVVFMTDGGMNTIDDPAAYGYDWACKAAGDCDDLAKATLLKTCTAMKDNGIDIYSVSYGQYANRTYVKDCASDESKFFIATTDEDEVDYIEAIYNQIADKVIEPRAVLTN